MIASNDTGSSITNSNQAEKFLEHIKLDNNNPTQTNFTQNNETVEELKVGGIRGATLGAIAGAIITKSPWGVAGGALLGSLFGAGINAVEDK